MGDVRGVLTGGAGYPAEPDQKRYYDKDGFHAFCTIRSYPLPRLFVVIYALSGRIRSIEHSILREAIRPNTAFLRQTRSTIESKTGGRVEVDDAEQIPSCKKPCVETGKVQVGRTLARVKVVGNTKGVLNRFSSEDPKRFTVLKKHEARRILR